MHAPAVIGYCVLGRFTPSYEITMRRNLNMPVTHQENKVMLRDIFKFMFK